MCVPLLTHPFTAHPQILRLSCRNKHPLNKFAPTFYSPLISHHCTTLLPFFSPFSLIPWGRRRCEGNWQPSLHRLSTWLLICMALIIDWSLQPQICDGLSLSPSISPYSLSLTHSFHLFSSASKYTPTSLPPCYQNAFFEHFSSFSPSWWIYWTILILLSHSACLMRTHSALPHCGKNVHLCFGFSSTCSLFFLFVLFFSPEDPFWSHSAVSTLCGGFMYLFSNKNTTEQCCVNAAPPVPLQAVAR